MKNGTYNIIFGGLGGQGVLKASEMCGLAAMKAGFHVKKSEVHGMAQRGGSVESHLRFGQHIYSPLIEPGKAGYLVCLHPDEHKRLRHWLSDNGLDLTDNLQKSQNSVDDKRCSNTFMVGVLSANLPIELKHWQWATRQLFNDGIYEKNWHAFSLGRSLVKS